MSFFDSAWRVVAEDAAIERGRHGAWLRQWAEAWGFDTYAYAYAYANAYADADANANADAYVDADADAYADANAYAYANTYADADANANADAYVDADADAYAYADAAPPKHITGEHMRPGLYLYAAPSSNSVAVLRVGWIRRTDEADEYEVLHSVTPLRGEYKTMLHEAQDKPPSNWSWTKPLKRPSPIHRSQIRNPVALDPAGYAGICPMPEGWTP